MSYHFPYEKLQEFSDTWEIYFPGVQCPDKETIQRVSTILVDYFHFDPDFIVDSSDESDNEPDDSEELLDVNVVVQVADQITLDPLHTRSSTLNETSPVIDYLSQDSDSEDEDFVEEFVSYESQYQLPDSDSDSDSDESPTEL